MKKVVILVLILGFVATLSCSQSSDEGFDHYWVTSQNMNVYKSAKKTSDILGELKFGDEVLGHESNLGALMPKGWLEIKYGEKYGYVLQASLAGKEVIDEMNTLVERAGEAQVQAYGETGKKTPLRAGPARDAKLIEKLKDPISVEVFGRSVVDRPGGGKESWYNVRLEDGRVGYIYTNNLKLKTPPEINQYTSIRDTVAWRELRERENPETGVKGKEYIVTYLSKGMPFDTDFSRFELYTFDPRSGQYATALAKGGILGKLPLIVRDEEDGKKIIEIRTYSPKKPGKIIIQEYSFPSPIKMVKQYEVDE